MSNYRNSSSSRSFTTFTGQRYTQQSGSGRPYGNTYGRSTSTGGTWTHVNTNGSRATTYGGRNVYGQRTFTKVWR